MLPNTPQDALIEAATMRKIAWRQEQRLWRISQRTIRARFWRPALSIPEQIKTKRPRTPRPNPYEETGCE
jgi:hypothetical protein